ncbi:MAG: hypothetical protein NWF00_12695 [Candidatus Bathyarchaeota archaeon]|nr:hypothetical protein [Candidatus Bathyarchaeota archaeon]
MKNESKEHKNTYRGCLAIALALFVISPIDDLVVAALFGTALFGFGSLPFYILLGASSTVIYSILSKKPKREYGVKSVTLRGEQVKSIGEKRIADYIEKNNIRYVYEQELREKSLFSNRMIGCPDFYLSDYDVYVEFWGLVNADDRSTRTTYIKNMKRKMARYYENNIRFISIYPDNLANLDWIFRAKFKKATGFELH